MIKFYYDFSQQLLGAARSFTLTPSINHIRTPIHSEWHSVERIPPPTLLMPQNCYC